MVLKFYDLFAGIGGFHLGLQRADPEYFKCIGACEINKYAAQFYEKRFGINPLGDAIELDYSRIQDFDLLCAGFPCQPFSLAGNRKGFKDERNGHLFSDGIVPFIKAKRPAYLFFENVKGLLSNDRGRTFAKILLTLDELGYDAEWQCINAKSFVPQSRERVYIVGYSREKSSIRKILPITESYRLDIQENRTEQESKERVSESSIANCIDAHYYKTTGGSRTLLMLTEWRTEQETTRVRRFTPSECERLMGLPDNWTEGIPETQRYRCIGNAVVPQVIEYIARRFI